jgi:type IV pilus assembly protein PilQ
MFNRNISVLFLIFSFSQIFGQNDQSQLDSLAIIIPELNNELQINVTDIELQTVIQAINQSHNINITLGSFENKLISYTFPNTKIKDFLNYICASLKLEIELYGNIILLKKRKFKSEEENFISYNSIDSTFSIISTEHNLQKVLKEIGEISPFNVALKTTKKSSTFHLGLKNVKFKAFLNALSELNSLEIKLDSFSNIYYLTELIASPIKKDVSPKKSYYGNSKKVSTTNDLFFQINDSNKIDLIAIDLEAINIIQNIGENFQPGYVIFNSGKLKNKLSLTGEGLTFKEIITHCLNGSTFAYKIHPNGFIEIGERELLNKKSTKIYSFQNRSYSNVIGLVPKELKEKTELLEHPEMNAVIITGKQDEVGEVINFFSKIDQRVPMVTIEIIIVDYNSNRGTQVGLDLSISNNSNSETTGTLSPGINLSGGSNGINQILKSFENVGLMNLGRVPSTFFYNLQLLESKGVISTKSTPKLTTINGQEASLSLGKSEYYLEVQNNIIGTQNPTISSSQNYKSVNADLTVNIKPVISLDGMVTLDISVDQSDFTARINENAPPGKVNRKFESIVRLQNEETIILGGLEDVSKEKTNSGLPFLSRIPIIKYLFGSHTNNKSKTRLNIFITPIIHY